MQSSLGVEYHLLNKTEPVELTPQISGRMVLFVNDAIAPLPWWTFFYDNNGGGAGQVAISRVEAKTVAAPAVAGR